MLESGVQAFAARLSGARRAVVVWETYAALADGIAGLAQPIFARRTYASPGRKLAPNHEPIDSKGSMSRLRGPGRIRPGVTAGDDTARFASRDGRMRPSLRWISAATARRMFLRSAGRKSVRRSLP